MKSPGLSPRSFAAELAKTPFKPVDRWFVGVDPDLHTTGLALVRAAWTEPLSGPVQITEAHADLASIPTRMRGLDAVDAMVDVMAVALHDWHLLTYAGARLRGEALPQATLVAEAQQIYAREEMPRAEIIAKANDLLRLAQITGAALALADQLSWSYTSELPADWKQQKKKEAHHIQITKRLSGTKVVIGNQYTLLNRPAKYGHAMDALGLALWAADRAASGTLAPHYSIR